MRDNILIVAGAIVLTVMTLGLTRCETVAKVETNDCKVEIKTWAGNGVPEGGDLALLCDALESDG